MFSLISKTHQNYWISRYFTNTTLSYLLLIVVAGIIYFPSLFHGYFCWDDKTVALATEYQNISPKSLLHVFVTNHVGLYHPITSISFMLDFLWGRGNPLPFHLTNLLLHCANTLLLYNLLKRLFNNNLISLGTCLLFVANPVSIEAVVWVSSRKDLLSTFFMLLSLRYYSGAINGKIRISHYAILLILISISLLSKIQTVTIPLLFLLIDYLKERKPSIHLYVEKIPFLIPVLAFGIINIDAQNNIGYLTYGFHYSLLERMIVFFYALFIAIYNIVVPFSLSIFYPYPFKPGFEIPFVAFVIPVLIVIGVFTIIYFRLWRSRSIFFSIMLFTISILIAVIVSWKREFMIADRYCYFASVGLYLLLINLVFGFYRKFLRYRCVIGGIMVIYLISLTIVSIQRVSMWKSPEILFQNALSRFPESEIILNTLGTEELANGKISEAIMHLTKAIQFASNYTDALYNRGIAHARIGNLSLAIEDYNAAISTNESYYQAWFARGNLYMRSGNLDHALRDFTMTIKLQSDNFGALQNRAIILGKMNDFIGALHDLNKAIELNPGVGSTYYLRGIALFKTGGNGCEDLHHAQSLGYKDAQKAIFFYCH